MVLLADSANVPIWQVMLVVPSPVQSVSSLAKSYESSNSEARQSPFSLSVRVIDGVVSLVDQAEVESPPTPVTVGAGGAVSKISVPICVQLEVAVPSSFWAHQ